MNPAAQAAAEHLQRRYDEVVERAITQALGSQDWSPGEILPRLSRTEHSDGETLYLDGEPLVWIGALKLVELDGHISAEREWRMLR